MRQSVECRQASAPKQACLYYGNCKDKSLPEFRRIRLEDKSWVDPILKAEGSASSGGCFGTWYLWGPLYGQTIARWGERILGQHMRGGKLSFSYPVGSGPLQPAIQMMEQLAACQGQPLVLKAVTAPQRQKLEEEMPGFFTFCESRDSEDYMYEVEKLASLSGKKLQAKRNHCNRFERENPDWRFEELTPAHFAQCLALLDEWTLQRQDERDQEDLREERRAIEEAFAHYEELGLLGGGLLVGDRMAAFTLGEVTGGDALDVRFEKADPNWEGAFAMVNREFARLVAARRPDLRWLNREEDLGLEALRKAKLSYRPAFLLEKFTAFGPGAGRTC